MTQLEFDHFNELNFDDGLYVHLSDEDLSKIENYNIISYSYKSHSLIVDDRLVSKTFYKIEYELK